ncbi:MAG: RNA polymerase sigma factor [Steroidobacteraceae bacterium]
MPHANEQELEQRFRELLKADYGRLRRIARSYASERDREDLLQEILLQLWRALPSFEGRANRSTWVYRIALNTALGALRKRYAQPATQTMSHDRLLPLAPVSAGDPVDADELLENFLAVLEPLDRAVLMLSLDDLQYTDIAGVTGLSVNAVGIRLNRIKHRFNQTYVENRP